MDYPKVKRKRVWEEVDPTDPKKTIKHEDVRTYYEWVTPDGSIVRAPRPDLLDRRRWERLGFTKEQIAAEKEP